MLCAALSALRHVPRSVFWGSSAAESGRRAPASASPRLGNFAGLHKKLRWLPVLSACLLPHPSPLQGRMVVGGATTIAELAQALESWAAEHPSAPTPASTKPSNGGAAAAAAAEGQRPAEPAEPFAALAATLRRVAGTHVRNAATVGGNLALAR